VKMLGIFNSGEPKTNTHVPNITKPIFYLCSDI